MSFDPKAYIADQNETEAAIRAGKEPETRQVPLKANTEAEVKEPTEEEAADAELKLPRHVRRELNRLRNQLGEANGRLNAYKEIGVAPKAEEKSLAKMDAPEDPEPHRNQFATDAEYNRALGRWDSRQETKKELGKRDQTAEQQQQSAQREEVFNEMREKCVDDAKKFTDWKEVMESAADTEWFETDLAKYPVLVALLASSDQQASIYYHLAKNPDQAKALLAMTADQQIRAIHRLEGKVEDLYADRFKEPEEKEKVALPAKKRLPPPSESVAVRSGAAPGNAATVTAPGSRRVNAEWWSEANERDHARR